MVVNRAVARCAGIAAALAMLCAGCARGDLQEGDRAVAVHAAFDSGAWKADTPGMRARMAQDLIERRLLEGKSRAEVKALLGAPDQEGPRSLAYFVCAGAGNVRAAAYAVRVEFDAGGERADEAYLDADTGAGDAGMD